MEYSLHKTVPEDQDAVDEFIHANFLPDMPLLVMFGLDQTPPPRPPPRSPDRLQQDFTVKAVDAEGQIIGVAINRVHATFSIDPDTPPEVKKVKESILQRRLNDDKDRVETKKSKALEMVEFLHFAEEKAGLDKFPEGTIELRVLSVHQGWRQRGVARRLAEESMRLARDSGFTTMKACCTSEYTARLARSLGWTEFYRLAYKDYPRLAGVDMTLNPTPPHEYFYYYVTDL